VKGKTTDYQARKDRILGVVVHEYIQSVTPVGSSLIVQQYFKDLSPATIRNILAELEEEGYLTHPHTSAGRIPTQFGYRYYVDNLMNEIKLLEAEKTRIQSEYQQGMKELERLLDKTSQVISDMTHYTSIVTIDGEGERIFCRGMSFVPAYPEFHDFKRIKHLLAMLEEKERIFDLINRELEHKVDIYIGEEMKCSEMNDCSLVISQYHKNNGPSGRLAILGPTRMDYERVVSTLEYFSDLMNEIL